MRRILLAAVLLAAASAHAQILSVYGTYSPAHFSNVQTGINVTSTSGAYTTQYTSFLASGVGGGVTLGILPIGPIRIGLDVRGSTRPGTVGADTAFVGLKVGLKAPLIPIKPYLQASGGYIATRSYNLTTATSVSNGTFTNQYGAYEIMGGIDYRLIHFVDLRLIEFGAGKGYNTGISFGAVSTSNDVTFYTINTGVVVHF